MEVGDYIGRIWDALKSIPKSTIESFFISDERGNVGVLMALFQKEVEFGRKLNLTHQKYTFFLRASGQLFVMYLLSSFALSMISKLSNVWLFILCFAFVIAVNAFYSVLLIFDFHPKAFKEILFENDYQTEQKEYRLLGFSVKLLCIIQICAVTVKTISSMSTTFGLRISWNGAEFLIEGLAAAILGTFILFFGLRYYSYRYRGIHVFRKDIPDKIQIVMAEGTLLVNPNHQFIAENSSGNLYIAPMNERVNPEFAFFPEPCQIPISDIFYIKLGAKQIEYDFKKKNWKYSNQRQKSHV